MEKKFYMLVVLLVVVISFFVVCPVVNANNLSISNVSIGQRDPLSNTALIEFDISLDNSWRNKINHDAVWLTVRLYDSEVSPTTKNLCDLAATGLNPDGFSLGTSSSLEIYVPADAKGAFLRQSSNIAINSVSSTDVQIKVDYSSCGFDDGDQVYATVMGIEMVFIPEGSFYAGDHNTSVASLNQGSSDSDPWSVTSESAISVTNATSNGYRYVSNGNANEDATGTAFSISQNFPKGFQPFYTMKYEITEGQWVEFINSLPSSAARSSRDLTNASHKNSDSVSYRNTISCSGSPLACSTSRPFRALNYLSWMDQCAFLDWVALRPMTELEFEKMARGPLMPVSGEFAWGSTDITAAAVISGSDEDGTEVISTSGANANFNNVTFSGGDSSKGAGYQQGPIRNGIFASSSTTRESAGAGYYGVMELSGNLREHVVTIGNIYGRSFTGNHGNGVLSTDTSYEGNADVSGWPGLNAVVSRGVTAALGSGFRGGSWEDQSSGARLRISDRNDAATESASALANSGGRGVRTYDGE